MSRKRRFDIPPKLLSWIDKLPGNPWEAFDQANLVNIDNQHVDWLSVEADPEASRLFFVKKRKVVVASGALAVQEAGILSDGIPAAAYLYGEYAHVRPVPKGFGYFDPRSQKGIQQGFLLDEGLNDFGAQMGFWDGERLVVPKGSGIFEQHVDVKTQAGRLYSSLPNP